MPLFGAHGRATRGFTLPERHLGLVQAGETADIERRLDALADAVEAAVDLDAIRRAARPRGFSDEPPERLRSARPAHRPGPGSRFLVHVSASARALALGRRGDLAVLAARRPGARPGADAVWLPGGYPELHAGTLAAAQAFSRGLRTLAAAPFRSTASAAATWCWAGDRGCRRDGAMPWRACLRLETSFAQRALHLGYRRARLIADCSLGAADTRDHGPRIPLCQRALERRRAAGRVPRCDRAPRSRRRRAARLGERHVLSFHRQATGMTATFDAAFRAHVPRTRAVAARRAALSRPIRSHASASRRAARNRQPCAVGGLEPALALRACGLGRTAACGRRKASPRPTSGRWPAMAARSRRSMPG